MRLWESLARKVWVLSAAVVALGFAFGGWMFFVVRDCPPTGCRDPILYFQKSANGTVSKRNLRWRKFILENERPFNYFIQDSHHVFIGEHSYVGTRFKVFNYAISKKGDLKSYVGGVFGSGVLPNLSLVCEAKVAGVQPINPPIDAVTCGEGTVRVEEIFLP